jgi:peptide/nickel transport system substrate-binding protein
MKLLPEEAHISRLIEDVRHGRLARRGFIQRLGALGVAMPMASLLLMDAGIAQSVGTTPAPAYKPTKRGGGGLLRLLYWQGQRRLQRLLRNADALGR